MQSALYLLCFVSRGRACAALAALLAGLGICLSGDVLSPGKGCVPPIYTDKETMMRLIRYGLLLSLVAPAMAEEALKAYNTYQSQPFVVGQGGLAADVVSYLNGKLKGRYQFTLSTVPRERLNSTVINDPKFKGVVLFMSPQFVGDADKTRFRWSAVLMEDANGVLSHPAKKIEYVNPDTLKGKRFAGILGNKYAGLEERFGKDIYRDDVATELANLQKVASGRSDVTIMSQSMYRYLIKHNGLDGKLHVSATPHISFSRHIFAAKAEDKLVTALDEVMAASKSDPAWKALLAKYSLN